VRRWLSLYALSITSIVILAFLVPLAVLVRDLAVDRAMNAAEREAQTVARFAATIDSSPASLGVLEGTLAAAPDTSVMLSNGTVVGAALPAGIDVSRARELGQAYRQPLQDGESVIVPVLRGDGLPWVIVIAVPAAVLTQGVSSAWVVLGGLGLLLIALAYVVADRMGRAVVQPINELVAATHRLGQGDLTVAVEPGGPSELAEVGTAFNSLTWRVSTLMDQERETAADISHRLRTPLTALRLDIESLGATADVSRLQHDVDELERVVSHVISEARRPVRESGGVVTDIVPVVAERGEFWGSLAADQDRPWSIDVEPEAFPVRVHSADFEALLDALLGNIFAHTPATTEYRIALRQPSVDQAELVVEDAGAGIADVALLERGSSGTVSTGLGVDIVRRTAESAGGSAHWAERRPSGTVVRIELPRAGRKLEALRQMRFS
jgi:signal transduction histidine kinase